jgi:hypothetical protein
MEVAMRFAKVLGLGLMLLVLFSAGAAFAIELPGGMSYHKATAQLSGVPNYEWYYGCSPTAAGMLMGYYDRRGYGNLVPGGVAELSSFGNSNALVNSIIASPGHVADFYQGGDGASGDDVGPTHAFDCLADFMGTSQDAAENTNGATTFFFWEDGTTLTPKDVEDYGMEGLDGMYGIGQYVQYAGYQCANLYTQMIDTAVTSGGFTFSQYESEIDAGRPVLLQLEGHTVLGYGYDDATNRAYVYDTFNPEGQTPRYLTWGGTYGSYAGMSQWGVTVLELVPVPEPSTLGLLISFGTFGVLIYLRRRRCTS